MRWRRWRILSPPGEFAGNGGTMVFQRCWKDCRLTVIDQSQSAIEQAAEQGGMRYTSNYRDRSRLLRVFIQMITAKAFPAPKFFISQNL